MNESPLAARLPAVDTAILVVLAAVLLVALALGASRPQSGNDTAAVRVGGSPIVATTTTSTDAGTSSASEAQPAADVLTDIELHDVLNRYATAYSHEDATALARLMTADIVRESAGQPTLAGITAVLGEYLRQFRANRTTGYQLDAPDVTRTDGAATLATRYTITTTNASRSTGAITMHVVRTRAGGVAIERISVRAG
jgi:Domain of unknown function (DUF4440)